VINIPEWHLIMLVIIGIGLFQVSRKYYFILHSNDLILAE